MSLVALGMALGSLVTGILFGLGFLIKAFMQRGRTLLIGQDPRGGPALVMRERLRDGQVQVKRKNGRHMDVEFPAGFLDATSKGGRVGLFDLATGEPFRVAVKNTAPPFGAAWEMPAPGEGGEDAPTHKAAVAEWKRRVSEWTGRARVNAHHYWELGQARSGDAFFRSMEGPWSSIMKAMPWLMGTVIIILLVLAGMVWKLGKGG